MPVRVDEIASRFGISPQIKLQFPKRIAAVRRNANCLHHRRHAARASVRVASLFILRVRASMHVMEAKGRCCTDFAWIKFSGDRTRSSEVDTWTGKRSRDRGLGTHTGAEHVQKGAIVLARKSITETQSPTSQLKLWWHANMHACSTGTAKIWIYMQCRTEGR